MCLHEKQSSKIQISSKNKIFLFLAHNCFLWEPIWSKKVSGNFCFGIFITEIEGLGYSFFLFKLDAVDRTHTVQENSSHS